VGSIWNHLFFELPASLVLGIEIKTLRFWNTIGFRSQVKLETPTELGPIEKAILILGHFVPEYWTNNLYRNGAQQPRRVKI
jgi:hypothetical protein